MAALRSRGGCHQKRADEDLEEARPREIRMNPCGTCSTSPRACGRFHVVLFGILWGFQQVSGIVVGGPAPSLQTKLASSSSINTPSISERTATFDFLQRASASLNSGLKTGTQANSPSSSSSEVQARDIFPRKNAWELISSSSDVIPLRSKLHNGSSPQFIQWHNGGAPLNPQFSVESRLQRLEHHFNSLRIYDDDCRQRLLCEIAESPAKFVPLTGAFLDETSFNGDEKSLASKLLETNDGTRLLTYIEATQRGASRQGCEIWTYRCPRTASSMIDFKALLVWREISKWLTVKFVAKRQPK